MAVKERDFLRFQNQRLLFRPKRKISFAAKKSICNNNVELKSSITEASIAAIVFGIAA